MRALRAIAIIVVMALAMPTLAQASTWGGIEPGVTTIEGVRERFGPPSKETRQKMENYDTVTWVYEGDKAPVGVNRMTVDFGILMPDGYKPNLVRVFALEPKVGIFAVQTVVDGWGLPSAAGDENGFPTMVYEDGLIAVFDKQGQWAQSMTFTVHQQLGKGAAAGAAPAPTRAPAPAQPTPPAASKPGPTPGGARP